MKRNLDFTKEELKKSILKLAEACGLEQAYQELLKIDSIPEVIKSLSYKMFVRQFNKYDLYDELFLAYQMIVDCARGLEEGEISFNEGEIQSKQEPGTTSIPNERWGVHATHCCTKHGCKYGDVDCPVELGLVKQEYPCESCLY